MVHGLPGQDPDPVAGSPNGIIAGQRGSRLGGLHSVPRVAGVREGAKETGSVPRSPGASGKQKRVRPGTRRRWVDRGTTGPTGREAWV